LRVDPDIMKKNYHEMDMLKAMDRAYWLRYYKDSYLVDEGKLEEIRPSLEPSKNGCPYSRPDLTKSIFPEMPRVDFVSALKLEPKKTDNCL